MGRRNLKIADPMVSFFLGQGFVQASPVTPIRECTVLDARVRDHRVELLLESPQFLGADDGTLDTVEVFNPVFQRDYSNLELWVAGRFLRGDEVTPWGLRGWRLFGVFDAKSRALDACERPDDFAAPVRVNHDNCPGFFAWDRAEFPHGRASELDADPDDRRGEVPGA